VKYNWAWFYCWIIFIHIFCDRSFQTAEFLLAMFKKRQVIKHYWCITKSVPNPKEGLDLLIAVNTHIHTIVLWFSGFYLDPGKVVAKKDSPTDTYPDHHSSLICFLHLLWSMASSLFNLCAWQSFRTTSVQVLFGLPLGLAASTLYSIHFFMQSLSSFCSTCLYHCNLFCCSTEIIPSYPSLSLNCLLGILSFTLMPQIHLTSSLPAEVSPHFLFL